MKKEEALSIYFYGVVFIAVGLGMSLSIILKFNKPLSAIPYFCVGLLLMVIAIFTKRK